MSKKPDIMDMERRLDALEEWKGNIVYDVRCDHDCPACVIDAAYEGPSVHMSPERVQETANGAHTAHNTASCTTGEAHTPEPSLVDRLRDEDYDGDEYFLALEAADKIEELKAEIERLRLILVECQ